MGILKKFVRGFGVNGIDAQVIARAIAGMPRYIRDAWRYRRKSKPDAPFPFRLAEIYPCFADLGVSSGTAHGHYFHQDLHVARMIFERRPSRHIDIGSRIDGFVGHLLTFMPVECVDIRHIESNVMGLAFIQSDATDLEAFPSNSVDSLSTLHVAEHFGLGRYGDPVDPEACFRYMRSLARVLAPQGRLYFSVPVGRERVEFNAHRVFAPETILKEFSGLALVSFAAVLDDKELHSGIAPSQAGSAEYACGIFEFTKL